MIIKKILYRMLQMCPDAWYIFTRSLQLTIFLLFIAFVLFMESKGRYDLFMTATTLFETGPVLILFGSLFSVLIEDFHN